MYECTNCGRIWPFVPDRCVCEIGQRRKRKSRAKRNEQAAKRMRAKKLKELQ